MSVRIETIVATLECTCMLCEVIVGYFSETFELHDVAYTLEDL